MPIITLTTDWNKGDYYIAAVKGALLAKVPNAQVIDLSHEIRKFQSAHAALLLKSSFRFFPDNTIHIIGVNTESTEEQPFVVCKIENQFFLGTDNGQFSLISERKPELIIKVEPEKFNLQYQTFPVLHLYINVVEKIEFQPAIDDNSINGRIIYIDSYGNGFTNISRDLFERVGKERKFEIWVKTRKNKIEKISTSYNQVSGGDLIAIFNSLQLLEIAINQGNAADLLDLKDSETNVIIKFKHII
jgi:S-adenosylmethionine hydrolase